MRAYNRGKRDAYTLLKTRLEPFANQMETIENAYGNENFRYPAVPMIKGIVKGLDDLIKELK